MSHDIALLESALRFADVPVASSIAQEQITIEIERIAMASARHSKPRCGVASCGEAATWFLADRDMPLAHDANLGERPCCTAHIAETFFSLRGAHVVANASLTAAPSLPAAVNPWAPRRRTAGSAVIEDERAQGAV